jgi:hypothetical protein
MGKRPALSIRAGSAKAAPARAVRSPAAGSPGSDDLDQPEARPLSSALMEPLTTDALRLMARTRGLALTEAELEGLLPLVQAARALIDAIEIPAGSETEPASQYRIL